MESRNWTLSRCWAELNRLFPEHQIYLRTNGKVRFVTLSSTLQIMACVGGLLMAAWIVTTTWTYVRQDTQLAAKDREIGTIKEKFDALSNDLSTMETDLARQAGIIEARQDLLRAVIEQGLVEGDALPDKAKAAPKSVKGGKTASLDSYEPGEIPSSYANRYTELAAAQEAIASKLGVIARAELEQVNSVLSRLDLSAQLVMTGGAENLPTGGPFIPASVTSTEPDGSASASELETLVDDWQKLLYLRHAMLSVPALVPLDDYYVSSHYGRRRDPITRRPAVHAGIDMAAWYGSKVKAATGGVVKRAGHYAGYGRMVEIDHGNGFKTRYGHMRKVLVKKGQNVAGGHIIGESGNSGRSTGPHLHYEVWFNGKPVNPKPYLEASNHVLQIQRRAVRN